MANPAQRKGGIGDIVEITNRKRQYYNKFEDYSGKQFIHLLDFYVDGKSRIEQDSAGGVNRSLNEVYLGSFVRTLDENEDPTYLGYDLKINCLTSPLFNGLAEEFIEQFGTTYGNSEIRARKEILTKFKSQLFRFLRTDLKSPVNEEYFANSYQTPTFDLYDGAKTYYLKKLTGLDNLNETLDGSEGKQFVEYGKDFITLGFHEDVTQNIGYLGALYKSLSWSRLRGKKILPDNLLRFDIDVEITEVRKYNRVINRNGKLEYIADRISKYTYTLYECQFFFPKLPHGDALDMSAITEVADYEIKFNYKNSTLKFSRVLYDPIKSGTPEVFGFDVFTESKIDNKLIEPSSYDSKSTNRTSIQRQSPPRIISEPPVIFSQLLGAMNFQENVFEPFESGREGVLESLKEAEKIKANLTSGLSGAIDGITNSPFGRAIQDLPLVEKIQKASLQNFLNTVTGETPFEVKDILSKIKQVNSLKLNPNFSSFSVDTLGAKLGSITDSVKDSFPAVKSAVDDIKSRIGSINLAALAPIKNVFNEGTIRGRLTGLVQNLSGAGLKTLTSNFDPIKNNLLNFGTNALRNNLGNIGNLVQNNLLKNVPAGLRNNLAGISSGLQNNLLNGLTSGLRSNLGNIGSLVQNNLLGGIRSGLKGNLNIKGFVQNNLLGGLKAGLSGSLKNVGSLVQNNLLNGIKAGFNSNNLRGLAGSLAGTLGSTLSPLRAQVSKFAGSTLNSILNTGVKSLGNIGGSLAKTLANSNIPARATQLATSLLGPANVQAVKNSLNAAKNNLVNNTVSVVANKLNSQASLINKTLGGIVNIKGGNTQQQIAQKSLQKAQNFVGNSLKSLFR